MWTFQPAELPGDLLTEITQLEQGPEETLDAYHIKLLRKSNRLKVLEPQWETALPMMLFERITRRLHPELRGALELNCDKLDLYSVVNYSKQWNRLNSSKVEQFKRKLKLVSSVGTDQLEGHPTVAVLPKTDPVCYKCNLPGHYIANCPTGAQSQTIVKKPTKDRGFQKSCYVCKKPNHTITGCYSHKRSVEIIKKRFARDDKLAPKEIYSVLLADPKQEEDLKEALRAEGVFNDTEDPERAIVNSLNIMAEKNRYYGGGQHSKHRTMTSSDDCSQSRNTP